MKEEVTVGSIMNKNTLLYGNTDNNSSTKSFGPSCVDMHGEKGIEVAGKVEIVENNKKPARP